MKYLQGKFLTGYVTLHIQGDHLEQLLQFLVDEGVYIWNVARIKENHCKINIRSYDLQLLQEITSKLSYRLEIERQYGLPYLFMKLKYHLDIVVASIISLAFFILLSQFIWSIDISGVSEEVEEKVKSHLQSQNIKQGTFKPFLSSLSDIQQNILNDIPELLWIGVEKRGTKLIFSGVEKITQEKTNISRAQHIVANKSGVIEKMEITRGIPLVTINDYVTKGQRLVSGDLADVFEEKKDEKEKSYIMAQGDVFARTWYEVKVSVPLKVSHERLALEEKDKYYLMIGSKQFGIWGFWHESFKHSITERKEYPLTIFNYEIPFKFIKETTFKTDLFYDKRSKEEAISAGVSAAKNSLQLQLEQNAKILSHKVLHERTESGKVKLNLLMTVRENIAEESPIIQGD